MISSFLNGSLDDAETLQYVLKPIWSSLKLPQAFLKLSGSTVQRKERNLITTV